LFGVRVDVFSSGFGPRLFGWKSGDTDYRVSIIPLGGYVRMAGQDPTDIDSPGRNWTSKQSDEQEKDASGASEATRAAASTTGAPDELMSKPRWQRAVISATGPAVNLVFPILL
jgi:regulator of sigma E protease